jgi:signal transduction histidine kinase
MGVPSLALSLFMTFEIADQASDIAEVGRQSELATSADGPTGLFVALQNERNWAVTELFGQSGIVDVQVAGYPATRADTDEALDGFEKLLSHSQNQTVKAYGPAVEGLQADLGRLRDRIDAYDGPKTIEAMPLANEVFAGYAELIEPFLEGTSAVVDVVEHRDLRRGAGLIDTNLRVIETFASMVRGTILYAVMSEGGVDTSEEIGSLSAWRDEFRRHLSWMEADSTGVYAPAVDDQLFGDWSQQVTGYVDTAISTGTLDLVPFLELLTVPEEHSFIGYQHRVASTLRDEAERMNDAAASRRRSYLWIVAGVWIVALAGMSVVGRSIVKTLHSLTAQAGDVARRRLPTAVEAVLDTPAGLDIAVPEPEPVTVRSRDEVADVASALNTVQQSALDLAVGQAVMRRNTSESLVNLGRRNQSLLARQLSFITELEKHEADPDNLANLFHLDHLATRMRRNAESLLVLGGVRAQARHRSSAPARIPDVIRAALGEVESYRRVAAPAVRPVRVAGHAVGDLVHLLAELVDNALQYSPPQSTVEVRGQDHHDGYTLTVVDRGMGMHPDEITRANERLAGGERFTVAPSKYLGHYVTGHLASRHDIQVRLHGAPRGGITATVHLPLEILVAEAALSHLPPPSHPMPVTPIALGRGALGRGALDPGAPPPGPVRSRGRNPQDRF